MYNIVYLLGAGASADQNRKDNNGKDDIKLPLANNFNKAILSYCEQNNSIFNGVQDNNLNNLLRELKEFSNFIIKFKTIDEAMRKLYLNKEFDLLLKYKKYISSVFYILECIHKFKDTRYEQFLLTLVDNDFKLPENIKILSWNYDNQFELASNRIFNDELNPNTIIKGSNFYKINGSAESFNFDKNWHEKTKVGVISTKRIDYDYHKDYMNSIIEKPSSSIQFTWEDPIQGESSMTSKLNDFLLKIKQTRKRTILVVIGYSFPYVNNKFDSLILNNINLHKVYFQNPYVDEGFMQDLVQRFGFQDTGSHKELNHIQNADRFYLPPEIYH